MPSLTTDHPTGRRAVASLAFVAAVGGGVAVLVNWMNAAAPDPHAAARRAWVDPDLSLVRMPPVRVSGRLPTDDPRLRPGDQVVGVTVGGAYRAYALSAFRGLGRHVVNDLLAGRPVTVAHCPRTGCTRVFTGPDGVALEVATGGWSSRSGATGMLLRLDGEAGDPLYLQATGEAIAGGQAFPYPTLEFELTSWGEWRRTHPDTDVYTSGMPGY